MGSIIVKCVVCVAMLTVAGCSDKSPPVDDCNMIVSVNSNEYCAVSMYALIANPSQYHGQDLRVVGYLKFDMNSAILGPSLDAVRGAIIEPDILILDFQESDKAGLVALNEKLVAVYGTFSYDRSKDLLIDKRLSNLHRVHEY